MRHQHQVDEPSASVISTSSVRVLKYLKGLVGDGVHLPAGDRTGQGWGQLSAGCTRMEKGDSSQHQRELLRGIQLRTHCGDRGTVTADKGAALVFTSGLHPHSSVALNALPVAVCTV